MRTSKEPAEVFYTYYRALEKMIQLATNYIQLNPVYQAFSVAVPNPHEHFWEQSIFEHQYHSDLDLVYQDLRKYQDTFDSIFCNLWGYYQVLGLEHGSDRCSSDLWQLLTDSENGCERRKQYLNNIERVRKKNLLFSLDDFELIWPMDTKARNQVFKSRSQFDPQAAAAAYKAKSKRHRKGGRKSKQPAFTSGDQQPSFIHESPVSEGQMQFDFGL